MFRNQRKSPLELVMMLYVCRDGGAAASHLLSVMITLKRMLVLYGYVILTLYTQTIRLLRGVIVTNSYKPTIKDYDRSTYSTSDSPKTAY
uniref:Uncharacterized protein n=1 Tax=Glossina palpalis gambiensis TaxID=67801 RepID=A0A1B0ASS4_9MUSC